MNARALLLKRPASGWPAALLLCASVVGCSSGDGLDRREVRGSVTMNGEPVESGTITLFPLGNGPVTAGRIANGTFVIEREHGPIPGDYRVEITGRKSTGKTIHVNEPGVEPREVPETKSVVPAQYNDRSKLTLTVSEADAVVEQTFELR